LVHCAHHKVGTVWWGSILRALAERGAWRYVEVTSSGFDGSADVYLFEHTRHFDRPGFSGRPFRGTHMVRDPRDVVVSGYFYHLWTEERWANVPNSRYEGLSYREALNRRDRHDGLLLEMERMCRDQLPEMLAWDYSQPEFLELKYEDVIEDEEGSFERVFRHYGLRERDARRALDIVRMKSFSNVSGRKLGDVGGATHLRSGRPGEWRAHFTTDHLDRWRELSGDGITRLGYESA
jgi:hypothetical protein